MTITTTTSKVTYTGNNITTVFAYTFKIFADSEIKVYVDAVLKTLTTHYTVSGAGTASGGNVTFTSGNTPGTGAKVVILRNIAKTQVTDYVENDSFPAETHESALDKLTMLVQDVNNTVTGDIFRFDESVADAGTVTITKNATDRANKVLAFDSSGGLEATQEIGVYKGNWATATAYVVRDIIKDTSNNNIYICITAHTSSGSQPISSNSDVAKWSLIVDSASATTSATNAATSATAAATSATASATSATASATSATSSASSASTATTQASNASTSASNAATSATNAATSYDNFDDRYLGQKSSDPSADNDGDSLITGALYFNTSNNVMMVYTGSAWVRTTPTSSDQTNINALSASAVIADMALLATTDCIADMAILGTSDVVADLNTLGTADVVADLNTLGTADVVADMNTLGTADVVADMNTLGTADVVSDMNTLATSANVTAMGHLGTAANVTAMGLLGTSANVTAMGLLGTSAVVTDLGILGTADVVADMNTLGTADVVSDMNTLGTSANVTAMSTCATNIADVNNFVDQYKIASSAPGSPSEGDLWYDSSNNVLKVYNGSSWAAVTSATAGITDLVDDTTPQLGGNLDLQSYNLSTAPLASGGVFSNPNTISGNTTITTASTTNQVLFGSISVTGTAVLTLAGNGALTII